MDDLRAMARWFVGSRGILVVLLAAWLAPSTVARGQRGPDLGNPDFDRFRLPDPRPDRSENAPKQPARTTLDLDLDALREEPETSQLELGRLALEAGQMDEALASANRALGMRPGWYDALLLRAEVYTLQRRFDEAVADCDLAIDSRPDDPRAYLCRVDSRVRQKDFARALSEAETILGRWPENPAALAFRGNLRAEMGHLNAGRADFETLLARLPNHLGYRRDRLRIEIQANRPDLALRDLDWLLERRPYDAEVLTLRAESLARLDQFEAADEALGKAIVASPTDPTLFRNRAELRCLRLDRIEEGLEDFEECLELDPNDLEARIERASVYHKQGLRDEAIADLDQAITRNPVWTLLVYRALIHEESGHLRDALRDLDRAIDREPKAGPAYFARALVKIKLGEAATSAGDFEMFANLGSPGAIEGAGPIETVLKAIHDSQQVGRMATSDAKVRRSALGPADARR